MPDFRLKPRARASKVADPRRKYGPELFSVLFVLGVELARTGAPVENENGILPVFCWLGVVELDILAMCCFVVGGSRDKIDQGDKARRELQLAGITSDKQSTTKAF